MSDTYSVVLTGKLLDGFDPKSVQDSFSELFKLSQEKVQAYFNGKPKVVKKDADHQTATRYKAKIERLGASVELHPVVAKVEVPVKSLKKPVRRQKFKHAVVRNKAIDNSISRASCINAIDFGRKKQVSKMNAIEIAKEPRAKWSMFLGFSFIVYACADFGLDYLGLAEMSGTFWLPVTAALIGVVALKSSAES